MPTFNIGTNSIRCNNQNVFNKKYNRFFFYRRRLRWIAHLIDHFLHFFFFVYSHRPGSENNELRPLRSRYERDRQENEKPRRLFRKSDEFDEHVTTLTSDPTTQTPLIDSDLATNIPSDTYNLQLQDENNLLKKVN